METMNFHCQFSFVVIRAFVSLFSLSRFLSKTEKIGIQNFRNESILLGVKTSTAVYGKAVRQPVYEKYICSNVVKYIK